MPANLWLVVGNHQTKEGRNTLPKGSKDQSMKMRVARKVEGGRHQSINIRLCPVNPIRTNQYSGSESATQKQSSSFFHHQSFRRLLLTQLSFFDERRVLSCQLCSKGTKFHLNTYLKREKESACLFSYLTTEAKIEDNFALYEYRKVRRDFLQEDTKNKFAYIYIHIGG